MAGRGGRILGYWERLRRPTKPQRPHRGGREAGAADRLAPGWRGRRHVLPAAFVLAYLFAGGVTMAGSARVAGAGWLALHLVLLGAVTNAIVVWSEQFAAALLRTPASSERAALARVLALNLAVLAVLVGVHVGRSALTVAGAGLLAVVVVAHALSLTTRIRRSLTARLGGTVWFYVAASGALLAGIGLGVLMAGGATGSADAYRAVRLAHAHLNLLGWVGLAVLGTQFTLWPTVLRTRMVPGLPAVVNAVLLLTVGGLAVVTAGLLARHRGVALAGLAGYAAGLAAALVPFVRTLLRRPPHGAAAWMLAAGTAWFSLAVVADLAALLGSDRVVDLDGRLGRLVPAVVVGFVLQTLTGALTYLLPAVWGRGAHGNRTLTSALEVGWPVRVVALNLGVALLAFGPERGWAVLGGRWLAGLALGSFVLLAGAVLARRVVGDARGEERP
jgi:nitrite reductase (NO-forming)